MWLLGMTEEALEEDILQDFGLIEPGLYMSLV